MKRNLALRLGVFSAGLFALLLCFSPTFLVATDAFAQETKTAPAATAAPASAPTTTPTVTPTAEPKPTPAKAATEPAAEPPASSDKEQSWWQALLVPVLSVVGMFIAAFLAAGLRKLVLLVEKKWSIDIPDAVEKMMYDKARWAVGWAEEKAEKRLLYGDGKKTDGAQKITEVVDLLEKFAQSLGYGEEWQREKIEALAEGVLHLERGKTVGSTVTEAAREAKVAEKKLATAEG
jgi:hypothetical protein